MDAEPQRYRFDANYREEVTLQDGRVVTVRLITPEDAPLLEAGFSKLSDQSRFQRFMVGKNRLTPAEVHYLTDVDQMNHFAMGAVATDAAGQPVGLGVARFVRLPDRPDTAEPAVAVIDEAQGKGLGRILTERLVQAATERGIQRFRGEVLATNDQVLGAIRELVPDAIERHDGDRVIVEFELPVVATEQVPEPLAHQSAIRRVLAMAGARAFIVLRSLEWMLPKGLKSVVEGEQVPERPK